MSKDSKVIPFIPKKLTPNIPNLPGLDEYGVPNVPLHYVYGLNLLHRNKIIGTVLFTDKEKRDRALAIYNLVLKDNKQQAEFKYTTVVYPIF